MNKNKKSETTHKFKEVKNGRMDQPNGIYEKK